MRFTPQPAAEASTSRSVATVSSPAALVPPSSSQRSYAKSQHKWPPTRSRVATAALLAFLGMFAVIYALALYYGLQLSNLDLSTRWMRRFTCSTDSDLTTTLLSRALPIGRRDYASTVEGGKVYAPLTSQEPNSQDLLAPATVLSDDVRIGSCWHFSGGSGQIGVVLSELVRPSHVTVDHIPASLACNIHEAPRQVIVWGLIEGAGNTHKDRYNRLLAAVSGVAAHNRSRPSLHAGFTFVPLASFEYDIRHHSNVQTFPVYDPVSEGGIEFGIVVLEVLSNWGSDMTCLYRFRVHGASHNSTSWYPGY